MGNKNDIEAGKQQKIKEPPLLFSCRLSFFILCLFAGFTMILLRVNINFALVCMVKSPLHSINATIIPSLTFDEIRGNLTINDGSYIIDENEAEEDDGTCKGTLDQNTSNIKHDGEFEWDKGVQANILGSFFYGYVITNILGGWVSDKFGGKNTLSASIGIFSILTLFNPIASMFGPEYLFAIRLFQGITQGASMPLINVLSARWSGHTERAFLMGVGYGGVTIAAAIANPLASIICTKFGWEYIFYITGGMGILWSVVAWFLMYDWPEDHPRISKRELEFLQKNRAVQPGTRNSKKLIVPWKKIILSGPINVIHYCHFCTLWSFVMLGLVPLFFKEVLKMDIRSNGVLSSVPFIGMVILHWLSGGLFDSLRRRNICSVIILRKIFNTIGIGAFAISLSLVGLIPCTDNIIEILLVFFGSSFWQLAMMGGYFFSIYELAPRFAGIITGVANTFAVLPGFLCPAFVGYMTQNGTREEWLFVFYFASALTGSGVFVYLFFGSAELQEWADIPPPIKIVEMQVLEQKLIPPTNCEKKDETHNNSH